MENKKVSSQFEFDNALPGLMLRWFFQNMLAGRKAFAMTCQDKTFDWGPHARIFEWLEESGPSVKGTIQARKRRGSSRATMNRRVG